MGGIYRGKVGVTWSIVNKANEVRSGAGGK